MLHARHIRLVAAALCLGPVGCGGPGANQKDFDALKRRVTELAQREESSQQQIEELSTRLFLLEDKVDTEVVARQRTTAPARHPTIRIRPEAGPAAPAAAPAGAGAKVDDNPDTPRAGGGSLVAVDDVEYLGEAKNTGPRPVLRLNGSPEETRVASRPRRAAEPVEIDPTLVSEKLPVVPLPKRRAGMQVATDDGSLRDYREGLKQYHAGEHKTAINAFRSFLDRNPGHAYADNALYWLGECHYDMNDYAGALKVFEDVVRRYPDGNKVPDAMLKVGYCHQRLGATDKARRALRRVTEAYPRSRAARLASEALSRMP